MKYIYFFYLTVTSQTPKSSWKYLPPQKLPYKNSIKCQETLSNAQNFVWVQTTKIVLCISKYFGTLTPVSHFSRGLNEAELVNFSKNLTFIYLFCLRLANNRSEYPNILQNYLYYNGNQKTWFSCLTSLSSIALYAFLSSTDQTSQMH